MEVFIRYERLGKPQNDAMRVTSLVGVSEMKKVVLTTKHYQS